MVIDEHMYCTVKISGDEKLYTIAEKDIIDDNITITSQCCDDNTFTLGGVYSSQLSVSFRATFETNVYDIRGAMIRVYTKYGGEDFQLRGTFWVTSATRYQDVFTVSASDSLIWLDNIPTSSDGICDSLTFYLESYRRTPRSIGNRIVQATNAMILGMDCSTRDNLEASIESLKEDDSDMLFKWQNPDVLVNERTNYMTENNRFRHWHNGEEGKFDVETSPREHLSNIAQLVGGFAYALPNGDITFGRFFRVEQFENDNPIEITPAEVEKDTLDVSSKILYLNVVKENFAITDSTASFFMPLDNSELTYKIIIEDNPFLDGFYAEMKYTDYDYRHIVVPIVSNILKVLYTNSKFNTQYTEMNDTNWDGVQLNVANAPTEFTTHCDIRPFNLTCHKPHWFTVGQHVIIPSDAKGSSSFESTITKAVWTFRGGWELSCTGGDTRMLSETVKNSQAKKLQRAVLYKRKSS